MIELYTAIILALPAVPIFLIGNATNAVMRRAWTYGLCLCLFSALGFYAVMRFSVNTIKEIGSTSRVYGVPGPEIFQERTKSALEFFFTHSWPVICYLVMAFLAAYLCSRRSLLKQKELQATPEN